MKNRNSIVKFILRNGACVDIRGVVSLSDSNELETNEVSFKCDMSGDEYSRLMDMSNGDELFVGIPDIEQYIFNGEIYNTKLGINFVAGDSNSEIVTLKIEKAIKINESQKVIKINQTQKEIIKKYENLISQIATFEKEKDKLMEQYTDNQKLCTHPNVEVSDSGFSAVCPDCGLESAGWYCPESPDMQCNYVDPDTGVYDEDVCFYCNQPYERK